MAANAATKRVADTGIMSRAHIAPAINNGNRSKRVTSKQPESKENAKSIVERTFARRLSNPAYFLEPSLNPGNFYSHYREMHYRDADKQG